jgi:hypothetical protein
MRVITFDPVSMNVVVDVETAPFVIEGSGPDALKICFETEANKSRYLEIPLYTANSMLLAAYSEYADTGITGAIS